MGDIAENNYTARTWFQIQCDENLDACHLWDKARLLCTFKKITVTALYLFDRNIAENQQQNARNMGQGGNWLPEVHHAIRVLFDRIVTRWVPKRLSQNSWPDLRLSQTLTPEDLHKIPLGFTSRFDRIQERYQECFVPLLYHEIWETIKHDIKSMNSNNIFSTTEGIEVEIGRIEQEFTKAAHPRERVIETTLMYGSYRFQIDLALKRTFPKLSLCDILLVNNGPEHERRSFFAIVVHISDEGPVDIDNFIHENSPIDEMENHIKEVKSDIVLYVSKKCSDTIGNVYNSSRPRRIRVVKLSNLTSSRRHISAVYNLPKFDKQRSLPEPTPNDPYFFHPGLRVIIDDPVLNAFNRHQREAIICAESIFTNHGDDRLHLIHGPPGTGKSKTIAGIVLKLLPLLDDDRKILLCAPSNNACDELFRRILDENDNKYKQGTFVRVGREAPSDYTICEHFLESLIMRGLVERMTMDGANTIRRKVDNIRDDILRKAKVIVSTLNYSANNTLISVKRKQSLKFIIIDEACQSLEPDCLLPFYFGCSKVILVGDPKQLPPCVLSTVSQKHNLSQSLYVRLQNKIDHNNISMLKIQYRMHREICEFPNNHFYDGNLITDESVMGYWPEYPLLPYYLYNLIYTKHTCPSNGGSSHNKEEQIFIKKFCIKLLSFLVGRPYEKNDEEFIQMEKRIVVIAPYKAQVLKFRARKLEFPRHIEVITVDSAQGTEKDIVLISCVRSGGTIGFLRDERRLNVMLTRAKRALYIFGNLTQLSEQNDHWEELVNDAAKRGVISTVRDAKEAVNLPD